MRKAKLTAVRRYLFSPDLVSSAKQRVLWLSRDGQAAAWITRFADRSASLFSAGDSCSRLLRYHNRHLLFRRPSPAILSDHDNRMLPGQQWLREVVKCSISRDIRHWLSIDD
jgi:hypothetical protein